MEKHNFILALAESGHENIGFRCAELPSTFADSRVRESAHGITKTSRFRLFLIRGARQVPTALITSDVHRGLRIRPLDSSAATRPESSLAMTSSGHDGGGPGTAGMLSARKPTANSAGIRISVTPGKVSADHQRLSS